MNLQQLMQTNKFIIFMNLIRIVTLIGVALLIIIMLTNISEVKLLASDVCKLCMSKTGCQCWCLN